MIIIHAITTFLMYDVPLWVVIVAFTTGLFGKIVLEVIDAFWD